MVEVGLIDIQVHHARVGPANLGKVGVPEAPPHLGGFAPLRNLRLGVGVAPLHHPGDHRVALACPLQIGYHLAHSPAGVKFAQPGGGIGIGVVRSFLFLQVHQHHRYVQIPHSGQHVVAGGIGQELQNH